MVITSTTFTSQNINNNFHDASFSSYLNNKQEDGEIGVFDAEKYFNGVEINTPIPKLDKFEYLKNQQQRSPQNRNYKFQYGTPSVASESSLNSQRALLQNALKKSSSSNNNRKNQVQNKSIFSSFGFKCSCYDKSSVDVSDYAGEISFNKGKTTSDSGGTGIFVKPRQKHDLDSSNHSSLKKNKKNETKEMISTRKTLEVFGSPILDERCKSLSFDKRLKIPSWENASSKLVEEEIYFSTNCNDDFDENFGSDASSDLFEIESLTSNKKDSFFCTSPTCYAPSEVSIEWSVVTASEDQGSVVPRRSPIRTSLNSSNGTKNRTNREMLMPRRQHGKLLGCNSQKSVGVEVDAFTATNEKQICSTKSKFHGKSEMLPQMTKFKVEGFGARNEHGYVKPPLRRSLSPHFAQLLYV